MSTVCSGANLLDLSHHSSPWTEHHLPRAPAIADVAGRGARLVLLRLRQGGLGAISGCLHLKLKRSRTLSPVEYCIIGFTRMMFIRK